MTSIEEGVQFDLNADGETEQLSWTRSDSNDGFLVMDRDQDGTINDGTELFGNRSPECLGENKNGYAALAFYDSPENGGNADGLIDAQDSVFHFLQIWMDYSHDGLADPDELLFLSEVGIDAIELQYKASLKQDQYGNLFRFRSKVHIIPTGRELI